MLEHMLRLYSASMSMPEGVRELVPHLFGPPGSGKSSVINRMAELLGVQVKTINVSRMSPLEIEGLQMPVENNTKVHMIPAAWWSTLKEGDILLLDEFLRGFPEVYNGLLDILTSRKVGDYELPKVFIVAASNSVTTYDEALTDRLHHIPVEDPRRSLSKKLALGQRLINATGLHPELLRSSEMLAVLEKHVLPMYDVLDTIKGSGGTKVNTSNGSSQEQLLSLRHLIGLINLREFNSSAILDLITENNNIAKSHKHWQYYVSGQEELLSDHLVKMMKKLLAVELPPEQMRNVQLNLQFHELLVKLGETQKETKSDDHLFTDFA